MAKDRLHIAPSARRLTSSLRDIGYSFESAIADLLDNSIASGATQISINILYQGKSSRVFIADNGFGMNEAAIDESLRFGSKRSYSHGELGRYGLGLKTASLSQCRRLSVYSRAAESGLIEARCLDLDFIESTDDWFIIDPDDPEIKSEVTKMLSAPHGTVVVWQNLDRVLPSSNPDSAWARKKFDGLRSRLLRHLEMVFHRFLAGDGVPKVQISVNDRVLAPWDPFVRNEKDTIMVSEDEFEVPTSTTSGAVQLHAFCLPSRSQFSSPEAFEDAAGPRKWNRQQGIYVYRANRLVQWGGWDGIRTIDEHTKLARVALDFDTDLDDEFNINVAKMRVSIPAQLKKLMTRAVADVCAHADARYRQDQSRRSTQTTKVVSKELKEPEEFTRGAEVGLALKAAAARTGNYAAFKAMSDMMKLEHPELSELLGL